MFGGLTIQQAIVDDVLNDKILNVAGGYVGGSGPNLREATSPRL